MTRIGIAHRTAVRVLMAAAVSMMVLPLSAVAQTQAVSSGKATPPPAGWMEQWVGIYAVQGGFNPGAGLAPLQAPPGFTPSDQDLRKPVLPLLQPWARAKLEATDYNSEDLSLICRPHSSLRQADRTFQLLASPEKIIMITLTGGGIYTAGIRRIYLDRPHWKNPPLTYMGDWVAHWEGDTLVMDGTGFNEKTWLTVDAAPHTEYLHVVERWRLVANGVWMEKTITRDDRYALKGPYTTKHYLKKQPMTTPWSGSEEQPEGMCADTPEGKRATVKLYHRALQEWEESERTAAKPEP